jgi:nucleotide-binding universal stress UspA family protein
MISVMSFPSELERGGVGMRTIMLATDFSERSDRALRRASLLAKDAGARLLVVHVVDNDRPRRIVDHDRRDAEAMLRELATTMRTADGLACDTRVILDDPFAGIVEAARDAGPDLLVIGPHRRQILKDVFVGTTAERTIRSAACPVLMANAPPVGPHRVILLATDLSEGSGDAMRRFAGSGIGTGASLSLLHVFEAPALHLSMANLSADDRDDHVRKERTRVERVLRTFAASCGVAGAKPMARHDETTPAIEILNAAEDVGATLVVVSTRGGGGLSRMVLGSVAEEVLRAASVDVLAIPPPAMI